MLCAGAGWRSLRTGPLGLSAAVGLLAEHGSLPFARARQRRRRRRERAVLGGGGCLHQTLALGLAACRVPERLLQRRAKELERLDWRRGRRLRGGHLAAGWGDGSGGHLLGQIEDGQSTPARAVDAQSPGVVVVELDGGRAGTDFGSEKRRPRASCLQSNMAPSCSCGDGSRDDTAPMILCDNCAVWCAFALLCTRSSLSSSRRYHFDCIRLSESDADDIGQPRAPHRPCSRSDGLVQRATCARIASSPQASKQSVSHFSHRVVNCTGTVLYLRSIFTIARVQLPTSIPATHSISGHAQEPDSMLALQIPGRARTRSRKSRPPRAPSRRASPKKCLPPTTTTTTARLRTTTSTPTTASQSAED